MHVQETPGALRFIERDEVIGSGVTVTTRILQQQWTTMTWSHDTRVAGAGNVKTEWRDVPLVRDEK
jgi:hypothetical protein